MQRRLQRTAGARGRARRARRGRLGAGRRRRRRRPAQPQRRARSSRRCRRSRAELSIRLTARRAARRLAGERLRVPGGAMRSIYLLTIRQLAGKWRLLILLALCARAVRGRRRPHGARSDKPTRRRSSTTCCRRAARLRGPADRRARRRDGRVRQRARGQDAREPDADAARALADRAAEAPRRDHRRRARRSSPGTFGSVLLALSARARRRSRRARRPRRRSGWRSASCSTRWCSSGPGSSPHTRSRSGSSTSSSGRACSARS